MADDPELRESVGIDAMSRVLVINTEGATDPELYTELVGSTPELVKLSERSRSARPGDGRRP